MPMHPAFILFHAMWFWNLMLEAAMADLAVASGQKPALVLIIGGKSQ